MSKENMMRVVLVEPGKLAKVVNMENSLEAMQHAVGGYIEALYPYEDMVAIVCNEEGKMNGMMLNRALYDEGNGKLYDIIAGPFFICGCRGENFGSLTDEEVRKYQAKFRRPEMFLRKGQEIVAVKCMPEPGRDR